MWEWRRWIPVVNLTPQTHAALFTGPTTCVLEGQTFTPCNTATNLNLRRELLWANANGTAPAAPGYAARANIDIWRSEPLVNLSRAARVNPRRNQQA